VSFFTLANDAGVAPCNAVGHLTDAIAAPERPVDKQRSESCH
jgi:hypothetical protein